MPTAQPSIRDGVTLMTLQGTLFATDRTRESR
jgi:hypothetical protein